jgi:putative ubiquitin-RnfH superfamily antitoxin RatB of RatAB toxin-antitoxin module
MQVGIAYAESNQQVWIKVEVDESCTVQDAIEKSDILERFPHIDLTRQKVGIFGKLTKLDATLKEGDRIEIYRPIICDPNLVPRREVE